LNGLRTTARQAGDSPRTLLVPKAKWDAEVDLYCLPCAGGSTTLFREWDDQLPSWLRCVPVELAGRNHRFDEPLPSHPAVIDELVQAIRAQPARPFVLFGHSMGALLAYRLACALCICPSERRPLMVITSGRIAPGCAPMRDLCVGGSREDLIAQVLRYGGVPPHVLEDQDLAEVFLPIFESDYRLVAALERPPAPLLPIPLAAVSGDDEPDFSAPMLQTWSNCTSQWRGHRAFPGGHFYLSEAASRAKLLTFIAESIQPFRRSAGAGHRVTECPLP